MKVKQVIHLQIEQGELLERGKIGNKTEWKPVDAYSPFDNDVTDKVDYLKLSWDLRAIDLDDLTAPPGHLLTGNHNPRVQIFEIRATILCQIFNNSSSNSLNNI